MTLQFFKPSLLPKILLRFTGDIVATPVSYLPLLLAWPLNLTTFTPIAANFSNTSLSTSNLSSIGSVTDNTTTFCTILSLLSSSGSISSISVSIGSTQESTTSFSQISPFEVSFSCSLIIESKITPVYKNGFR